MPRQRAGAAETPSPRARRSARPHNSALMKFAMPPEEQPDRRRRAGEVAERQDRDVALPAEQHHRGDAAEEAAVERHAAVPQFQDLERMRGEIAPDCRTAHSRCRPPRMMPSVTHSTKSSKSSSVSGAGAAPQLLRADQRARIEPAEQDADDIGERIPADGERPDLRPAPDRWRGRAGRERAGMVTSALSAVSIAAKHRWLSSRSATVNGYPSADALPARAAWPESTATGLAGAHPDRHSSASIPL